MKKLTTSVIALSLAMIITCFCIAPTSVAKADETQPTVNVLIAYDESYEYIFASKGCSVADMEKRLQEICELIRLPFLKTYGINLNFTVGAYSDYIGEEHAQQCPVNSGLRILNADGSIGWIDNGQCGCSVPTGNCNIPAYTPAHHNNAFGLRDTASRYAKLSTNDFNVAAVFTAMSLCYTSGSDHTWCGGMSSLVGNGLACHATYSIPSSTNVIHRNTYFEENMIGNIILFAHEFSHLAGLPNADCSPNQPCIMSGGFDSVVSVNNLWCDKCYVRFNMSRLYSTVSE